MLTDYQRYRTMKWTSDNDECENACGVIMSEDRYVEGKRGNYCSEACRNDCESEYDLCSDEDDRRWERRQMGLTAF